LTGRQKERKYEEENVISYRMTIRKMEDAGIKTGSTRWRSLENSL
jgi:hypothetical protein